MDQKTIFTRIALHAWQIHVDRATNSLCPTDEELHREIAPGKNRVIYLVGHLLPYDVLPEILGLGKRAYPFLQPVL
jgi:hypothetical protein